MSPLKTLPGNRSLATSSIWNEGSFGGTLDKNMRNPEMRVGEYLDTAREVIGRNFTIKNQCAQTHEDKIKISVIMAP